MRDVMFDMGVIAGAVLCGAVFTAAVIAAWYRREIGRLAKSRRALDQQWVELGEIWTALDPTDRPVWRLTWSQRTAVAIAVAKAAIANPKPATQKGRP